MKMKLQIFLSLFVTSSAFQRLPSRFSWKNIEFSPSANSQVLFSSNADIFGKTSNPDNLSSTAVLEPTGIPTKTSDRLMTEAQKLRKEAAELEMALREEARAKGLPEEMINKLVPIRSETTKSKPAVSTEPQKVVEEINPTLEPLPDSELRNKLGYLNTEDPVRFVSELQRIKMRGHLSVWDSITPSSDYNVNAYQLKANTGIDPATLKLDEVGYDYKKVIISAMILGTVLGLSSSQIGGQTGFLMGYASALIPIVVVGIGSIAPALIGDILLILNSTFDEGFKERLITLNAAKFIVGYSLGLPIRRFDTGGVINSVDFFPLRPTGKIEETKMYFAKKTYTQNDVARSSIVSIAGSVAECIKYGEASGNSAADVNTLQQLVLSIEPALTPDNVQAHIRWSAFNAYNILSSRKDELEQMVTAFKDKKSLEECISILECRKP